MKIKHSTILATYKKHNRLCKHLKVKLLQAATSAAICAFSSQFLVCLIMIPETAMLPELQLYQKKKWTGDCAGKIRGKHALLYVLMQANLQPTRVPACFSIMTAVWLSAAIQQKAVSVSWRQARQRYKRFLCQNRLCQWHNLDLEHILDLEQFNCILRGDSLLQKSCELFATSSRAATQSMTCTGKKHSW